MPRTLGSGTFGRVRSLRFPLALDTWFERRLCEEPARSASELLLEILHGGLRLEHGYMLAHRRDLEALICKGDAATYVVYLSALRATFGDRYVEHLERWLEQDGLGV